MPRIRFVQTSDVHLRSDRPDRRRALELAFEIANTRNADAVLIAGDLFDRTSDATAERAFVRELIESLAPRPVVIVPGNHDQDAYPSDVDFGANARVLREAPYSATAIGGLELIGVPYQQGRTAAECLTTLAADPRCTVLLLHGTLAVGTSAAFVGEGEDGAYMPIFPADLARRCCYAALGHLHSGSNLVLRDAERLFAYAGSPVTTSRRELGPRGVLVVDVEAGVGVLAYDFVPLGTPFYDRVEVVCSPGREQESIDELVEQALALKRPGAWVLARLSGVSTLPEPTLREAATRSLGRAFAAPVQEIGSTITDLCPAVDNDPLASFPVLELGVTSYAALAQVPVVNEFVNLLRTCAAADGADNTKVFDAALRLGLGAFLEVLS